MSDFAATPEPVDLDLLDAYLSSDRAPPDCMDLSQLDGFLAGVLVGPAMILPSEFLPVIWDGEEPEFADAAEAEAVMGTILARYNEIGEGLQQPEPDYAPVFWEDAVGNSITEDWAVGFMQAVALRSDAWEPVLFDEKTAPLLISIGVLAGMAHPELGLNDVPLPEGFLDELTEHAAELLPGCVVGLRSYWIQQARTAPQDRVPSKKQQH